MKVEAFTPKGKVVLDLTVAKDIETFGGQASVNMYIRNYKIQEESRKILEAQAEDSLVAKGELEVG